MTRQRVSLRLIEKVENFSTETDRIDAVQRAVEKLGDIEWESAPKV